MQISTRVGVVQFIVFLLLDKSQSTTEGTGSTAGLRVAWRAKAEKDRDPGCARSRGLGPGGMGLRGDRKCRPAHENNSSAAAEFPGSSCGLDSAARFARPLSGYGTLAARCNPSTPYTRRTPPTSMSVRPAASTPAITANDPGGAFLSQLWRIDRASILAPVNGDGSVPFTSTSTDPSPKRVGTRSSIKD